MKIALFSDIHANLPAFEAMLADMDIRKPDAVYCLGDLIGYHVWPNEIIANIRKRGIATLAGNHDLKVIGLVTNPQDLNQSGKNYAYHLVNAVGREYLSTLPAHITLKYQPGIDKLTLLLVHGSPRKVDDYILEDTEEGYILELMDENNADILCVGHSHKPFYRVLGPSGNERHVINIGSVGKPKDGDTRCCYVLLDINPEAGKHKITVDFIRVAYDIDRAATAIEESFLPNELADMLRKAY